MSAQIKCFVCDFSGDPEKFDLSISIYHDFYCPECGTSNLDTSELNEEWKQRGEEYSYGDNNTFQGKL